MAKVFALAKQFEAPELTIPYNHKEEEAKEEKFLKQVKAWAKDRNPTDEYAGEEYSIQHADGYARYLVLSSKPVQLMHLPLGDAWDSPWADRVTKKDIIQDVERWKNVTPIFGNSKK